MVVNVKAFSEVVGKDVFTLDGKYCGKVKDFKADLRKFKVTSLIIEAFKGTFLSEVLGGEKKGVIVPFSAVEAVDDIVLVRNIFKGVSEESSSESSGVSEQSKQQQSSYKK